MLATHGREQQPAPRPETIHPRRATSVDFDDDSNEWLNPPQDSTGEPIWVDMRVNIDRLSHIDTVQSCLTIKVALVMYWNDERLIGWDNAALPPMLWGPWPGLTNELNVTTEQAAFVVTDPSKGRLKRVIIFSGQVSNPMDLRDFPMDVDSIDLDFVTSSHWKTFDQSLDGGRPAGVSYRLRKICQPGEGQWLRLVGGRRPLCLSCAEIGEASSDTSRKLFVAGLGWKGGRMDFPRRLHQNPRAAAKCKRGAAVLCQRRSARFPQLVVLLLVCTIAPSLLFSTCNYLLSGIHGLLCAGRL